MQSAHLVIDKPCDSHLILVQFCKTQLRIIDQWRTVLTGIQQQQIALTESSVRNCTIQALNREPKCKSLFDTPGSAVPFISGNWLKYSGFDCGQAIQVVSLPQLIIIIPAI